MTSFGSTTFESTTELDPQPDDIRDQLGRLLESPDLEASDRRRAFLKYIVEETLAGRADRLKGYSVAVSVFGRDETFDPQADPVVRLEARRLRRDLDSYYVGAGSRDPVRITIPKGSYVPRFEWTEGQRTSAAPDATPTSVEPDDASATAGANAPTVGIRTPLVFAIIVLAAVAIASALLIDEDVPAQASVSSGPAVVVLPFDTLASSEENRYLARGLTAQLVDNLVRFPGLRLYTLPSSFDAVAGREPVTLGRDLGVAYVVSGRVTPEAGNVHVGARLLDATTGAVVWSGNFDESLAPETLIRVQREIAGQIASELGQPYGIVNKDLGARDAASGGNMESYMCVLRAYDYRRFFSPDKYAPVLGCLESAVRRDPGYSDAWAMLGWLYMDGGRFEFAGPENVQEQYRKGLDAGTRALDLAPDSPLALKALASINHYMGRYSEGERLIRRAAELNPYDPDTLAQLGWRLAVRGKFEEGIPILERAIARTANPPGWYYHLVAMDLYLRGDYEEMLEAAERSAVDGSSFSQTLIAIAKASLGDASGTRDALRNIAAAGPLSRSLAEFMRRHGATDELVASFVTGFDHAQRVAATSSAATPAER